jgi:hypothetical protein
MTGEREAGDKSEGEKANWERGAVRLGKGEQWDWTWEKRPTGPGGAGGLGRGSRPTGPVRKQGDWALGTRV